MTLTPKVKAILCRWGFHAWRWIPGNRIQCTVCGKEEQDLP